MYIVNDDDKQYSKNQMKAWGAAHMGNYTAQRRTTRIFRTFSFQQSIFINLYYFGRSNRNLEPKKLD